MKIAIPADHLLKPDQVSFLFDIPVKQVWTWTFLRGKPEPIREPGRRTGRYRAGDVAAYLEARGEPVPVTILPATEDSEVTA